VISTKEVKIKAVAISYKMVNTDLEQVGSVKCVGWVVNNEHK
jgi:hypothetical protein